MTNPTTGVDTADPARIRDGLPEPYRDVFLAEYHAAATAAASDPDRYRELQRLLHTWNLRGPRLRRPGLRTAPSRGRRPAPRSVPTRA